MKKSNNNLLLNWIETFLLILALWIIMSGIFEVKFLAYAAISCVVIATMCVRTLRIKGVKTGDTYFLLNFNVPRMLVYFFWLMVQIVKSALYVSGVVLFHRDKVDPGIVWFRADYDNPAARALLANSITLTPGTITIDIYEDGLYSVHGLTKELQEGVLDGSMQAKVAWAYGETINFEAVTVKEEA